MSTLNVNTISNEAGTGAPDFPNGVSVNSNPIATAGSFSNRNKIINGNFDIWQRGTSFSNPASNAYNADRWKIVYDGSGATRTISRQAFTLGQTDVPNEPSYFLRYDQSVAGSGGTFNGFNQFIESVRTFAGQAVVLSFWAKASSSLTLASIGLTQRFGGGGSPSPSVFNTLASGVSIGTGWQKYSYSISLPSISGKTLGSNGNDALTLDFNLPLNTVFTFDIAQVQLEAGDVATPFEMRPIGQELLLCQRYYQTGLIFSQGAYSTYSGGYWTMGTSATLATEMRATPSVRLTIASSGGYSSSLETQGITSKSVGFNALMFSSGGSYLFVDYAADAEI